MKMKHKYFMFALFLGIFLLAGCDSGGKDTSAVKPPPTAEERVASALASKDMIWVQTQLKIIPEGTAGREKIVAHLDSLNKEFYQSLVTNALASNSWNEVLFQLDKIPIGTPGREEVEARLPALKKEAIKAGKERKAVERREAVIVRTNYAAKLREKFLDDGMDIKVSISGASATRLNLEYSLFNAVWVHKFRKGSLSDEIGQLGFTKVGFSDGYDYSVVVTYN